MDGPPQPSYEMPPPRSPGGRDSAGGPPPQPSYEMPPPRSPGGRRDPAGGPPPQPSYEMPPPRPSYDEAPRSPPREAPPRYATFASPVKDEPAADEVTFEDAGADLPGWRVETRKPAKGRAQKVWHGPDGARETSKKAALALRSASGCFRRRRRRTAAAARACGCPS